MGKSSTKKRRQRERRRRELDRLRGVSLADSATPTPKFDNGSAELPNELVQNHGNAVSFPATSHTAVPALSTNLRRPQHEIVPENSLPVHSIMAVPLNGPKAPSWKRVDFVLPRAMGQNEFLFAHPVKNTELQNHGFRPRKDSNGSHDEKVANQTDKKRETIDEILFPGKPNHKGSDFAKSSNSKDDKGGSTASKTSPEDVSFSSRRRKLEDSFERVHRESIEKTVDSRDFVDLPNREQEVLKAEHFAEIASATASSSQLYQSSLALQPEQSHNQAQRKHIPHEQNGRLDSTKMLLDDINRHQAPVTLQRGELSGRSVEEAVRDKHGMRPRANSTDGELNLPQGGLCDERMVLEAFKWNIATHRSPKGFHNLGNTCFLNATLQCLAHVPPLCQTLFAISERHKTDKTKTGNKGKNLTFSLCSLFRQAHGIENAASMGGIAPRSIVNALPSIGSCGSRNGYKFRPGRQEDAHEFLVHLLDAMNDGELRAAGINQHISGWRERLPVSRLDETTFIHRIFGGYFRSQVKCQKCHYCSNTYDPFLDLSLEVSKKSSNSVLEALSQFTRKETLDAENQWKCSGCKKYVCPTKQLTVFRPPLALCIQLKRFAFNNSFGFGMNGFSKIYGSGGSKISKPINFPANLNLPLSDKRSCSYSLTGIVIHVGGSASSGHYTACVKRPGKNGSSQWYHLDDSFVEPISEKAVLRQRDAYLLFYCRKEVKIEYPTPPPRSMSASEAAEFGRIRARARADSHSKKDCPTKDNGDEPAGFPLRNAAKLQRTDLHPLSSQERRPSESRSADDSEQRKQGELTHRAEGVPLSKTPCGSSAGLSDSKDQSKATEECESDTGHHRNTSLEAEETSRLVDIRSSVEDIAARESSSEGTTSEDDSTDDRKRIDAEIGVLGKAKNEVRSKPAQDVKTRVVVDSSDSRGKVKVMLGPRNRKFWQSKTRTILSREKNYQLLGNLGIKRWDEDDSGNEKSDQQRLASSNQTQEQREKIVENIHKEDQFRKRKMHLDRWDSHLDQGRQKKVKSSINSLSESESGDPTKNRFQSLQASIQKMVRGKAKGFGRLQTKNIQKKFRNDGIRR
ncbi:ubiquitin carboxyl-terminal hydrolase [Nitzschia inconspicua]|uniref:ubiquitinyl hydrolase 1 n=1 Tax=Nitzschia inconspicua TaxID=303405 RepID=A0A9K3LN73_9STRA|nr:ubiquitin carboxyl-terminal hydrolase [Nitzschia inconspicua]